MDFFQLFAWFCKLNGIYGDIIQIYKQIDPHKWKFQIDTASMYKIRIPPREWIEDSMYTTYYIFDKFMVRGVLSDKMKQAQRKWRYFWNHNVIMDLSELETDEHGRTVAYLNIDDDVDNRKVFIDKIIATDGFSSLIAEVSNDQNRILHNTSSKLSLRLLVDKNKNPLKVKFYVKRNKKTYGKRSPNT